MNLKRFAVVFLVAIAAYMTGIQHDADAAGKPTIYIKYLVSNKNVKPADAEKLSKIIEEEVIKTADYDVMSQGQVKELFQNAERQQLMNCNSEACINQIARTTSTDFMIYGDISKDDTEYTVSVTLMERRKGGNAVLKGSSTRFTRTFETRSLKQLAKNIIEELHGNKITEHEESDIGNIPDGQVKFRVITEPREADLYIQGNKKKSRTHIFPEGKFNAELKYPGYEDYKFTINLPSKTEYKIKMERLKYKITFNLEKGMEPGIDIFENEKHIGTINEKGLTGTFESGEHLLTFKKRGYKDRVETYSFSANRSYAIKMKKDSFALNITSSEKDATVFINGKNAGKTPFNKKFEFAEYKVRVEKDGYLTEETDVDLDKDKTLNFTLREKKFVEFRVETKPAGADVYFGGMNRGKTPATFQFPEGDLNVRVEYKDCKFEKKLSLKPGRTTQVLDVNFCTLNINSVPAGAAVYINGEKKGKTPSSYVMVGKTANISVEQGEKKMNKEVSLNNKENEQRVDFDFSNFGFEIDKYMKEKMVYIRGGTFIMGAPKNEAPCVELDYKLAEKFKFKYNKKYDIKDETQHRVTLSPFWIGKYEISQMEYKKIMGANPSHFKKWFGRSNDFPVENVSWYDAIIYCNNLSARCGLKPYYTITTTNNGYAVNVLGGKGFRLPTEAEWEYACRAGSWRAYSTGDEISSRWKANYDGRYLYYDWFVTRLVIADDKQFRDKNGIYRGETVDVDSFDPNEFGLYNMHGNVGEWCWDYYGSYFGSVNPTGPKIGYSRIIRGGGYNLIRRDVRSASRRHAEGTQKYYNTGFRIVRSTD